MSIGMIRIILDILLVRKERKRLWSIINTTVRVLIMGTISIIRIKSVKKQTKKTKYL